MAGTLALAGEMNGFLKLKEPLVAGPLLVDRGELIVPPPAGRSCCASVSNGTRLSARDCEPRDPSRAFRFRVEEGDRSCRTPIASAVR